MESVELSLAAIPTMRLADALLERLYTEKLAPSLEYYTSIENILVLAISVVRSSFNSFSAINRIPPEILALIFQSVPSSFDKLPPPGVPTMWPQPSVRSSSEALPLTLVCHHWRQVALAEPSLWSSIDTDNMPPMTQIKASALKVYSEGAPNEVLNAVTTSHGLRITELHLIDVPHYHSLYDYACLQFPAPQLEYLTLSRTAIDEMDTNHPFFLFQGDAPRLKVLIMQSIGWLPRNQFKNLTHLCISDTVESVYTPSCNLPELLTFLSDCSGLQDLALSGLDFLINDDDTTAAITLRDLRRLSLRGLSNDTFAWILTHVLSHVPITMCLLGLNFDDPEPALLSTLRRVVPTDGVTGLTITTEDGYFTITASGTPCGIRIGLDIWPADCPQWPSTLRSIWSLDGVRELRIGRHALIELKNPATLLHLLPSLTTLVLSDCSEPEGSEEDERDVMWLSPMFNALARSVGDSFTLPCPRLSTLHIWLCTGIRAPTSFSDLAATRARHGHPIEHLVVDCRADNLHHANFASWDVSRHVASFRCRLNEEPPLMELPGV